VNPLHELCVLERSSLLQEAYHNNSIAHQRNTLSILHHHHQTFEAEELVHTSAEQSVAEEGSYGMQKDEWNELSIVFLVEMCETLTILQTGGAHYKPEQRSVKRFHMV
jgi:hypothetical protein